MRILDSESRDQYPPGNQMVRATGFARRLRIGGSPRYLALDVEISRLITLDQLHWSGTRHISRDVICEQAVSRRFRWRRRIPCCRIMLCGRGLDGLYGDYLLPFQSKSDNPPPTAFLDSAFRLLEAVEVVNWPVVSFTMRGVSSKLTSRTFCRVIPSLVFCDGLV